MRLARRRPQPVAKIRRKTRTPAAAAAVDRLAGGLHLFAGGRTRRRRRDAAVELERQTTIGCVCWPMKFGSRRRLNLGLIRLRCSAGRSLRWSFVLECRGK